MSTFRFAPESFRQLVSANCNLSPEVVEALEGVIDREVALLKNSRLKPTGKERREAIQRLRKRAEALKSETDSLPSWLKGELAFVRFGPNRFNDLTDSLERLESSLASLKRGKAGRKELPFDRLIVSIGSCLLQHNIKPVPLSTTFENIVTEVLRAVGENQDSYKEAIHNVEQTLRIMIAAYADGLDDQQVEEETEEDEVG